MAATGGQPDLSAFQKEVARMFFALPASKGFLLAGGAALLAQHLTARPTEDLDFFTAPERGRVPAARDALETEARRRGWTTERIHDCDTFCRMVVRSPDAGVLIDLAVNAPPDLPASASAAGPTLAPRGTRWPQAPRLVRPGRRAGLRRRLRPGPPVRQGRTARPGRADRRRLRRQGTGRHDCHPRPVR